MRRRGGLKVRPPQTALKRPSSLFFGDYKYENQDIFKSQIPKDVVLILNDVVLIPWRRKVIMSAPDRHVGGPFRGSGQNTPGFR